MPPRPLGLRAVALALPMMVALLSHPARAQSGEPEEADAAEDADEPTPADVAEASRLYEQGTKAHAAGRFAEAARLFAAADDRVPDASALEAALLAVLETEDAVLATRLATRAAREPFHDSLTALAERVRRRFADRVGRVVVHCDGCEAAVDGVAIAPGIASVVEVGSHEVTIVVGSHEERRRVTVEPSSIVTLLPVGPRPPAAPEPAPAPDPPPPTASDAGPSPVWFWVGVGLTAAATGGAIASGVDTASKHAAFDDEPTQDRADAGEAAQLRTNALIGASAGLAVITGVLGLFVVDWGADDGVPPAATLRLRPTGVVLSGRFP